MYQGKKILVVICARGGSKGIPGKNIKPLAGKPLIAHSILAAKKFGLADRIIVSTDDEKIKAVAQEYGAETPFTRPAELANDTIGRIAAVIHAVQAAEAHYHEKYDIVMDLGNMAPLRNQEDMMGALKLLVDTPETDVVYTVTPAGRNPYYNMVEIDHQGYSKMSKTLPTSASSRQTAPKVYDMNDSIYAIWRDALIKHKDMVVPIQLVPTLRHRAYMMPEERSIDIDRLIDFQLAELLMSAQQSTLT
jgi:CMP-N,N'-diacetyllegionaminic acid synthase